MPSGRAWESLDSTILSARSMPCKILVTGSDRRPGGTGCLSPGPDGYTSRPVSTILGGIDFCSRLPRNGTMGTVSQSSRAEGCSVLFRCATSNRPQASSEASTGGDCHRSIAATSFGVAGRMEGHAIAFSKQTNSIFSPSARGTESFLERRKPPRKCRLNEWSPGETWYTLICRGEMEPTFEPSRKTLTTPPSPIAGLGRWPRPRPSPDAARTTSRVGNAGQIRFGDRHSRMVAPARSPASDVSPSLVSATTSAL